MKSETLLALAGIGATTFTAALGLIGTTRQAKITSRSAAAADDQKARRQAYGACATALMARRNAVTALGQLFLEDDLDHAAAGRLLAETESLRSDAARAVGAVMIEGPEDVARNAERASDAIEHAADRYKSWITQVAGGRLLTELCADQMQYAGQDQADIEHWIDGYAELCRRALHPGSRARLSWPGRVRARLRTGR